MTDIRDDPFLRLALDRQLLTEQQARACHDAPVSRAAASTEPNVPPTARAAVAFGYIGRPVVSELLGRIPPVDMPRRLGRYEIVEKLGQGGMGAVYRCRDLRLDRVVAVKTLVPELAANREFVARFEREARLAAQFKSPHCVRVYDFGEEGAIRFSVMEFVDGESAAAILKRERKLDARRACAMCADVAMALQEAQAHHIIHRDIKPANIMVDRDGTVKLADLGIAKQLSVAGAEDETRQLSLTVGVLGTPRYMSPEQCLGSALDFRSDVFSLGATLYHLVCGEAPFGGDTPQKVMMNVIQQPVPDPRLRNPGLPPEAADVIRRMMAKQAEDRHSSLAGLISELQAIARCEPASVRPSKSGRRPVGERPVDERPAAQPPVSRQSAPLAAAGMIVAVALCAVCVWQWSRWRSAGETPPAVSSEPADETAAIGVPPPVEPPAVEPPAVEPPAAHDGGPAIGPSHEVPVRPVSAPVPEPRTAPPAVPVLTCPADAIAVRAAQQRSAQALGVPAAMKDDAGLEFVLVPAGEFSMGSHLAPEALAERWPRGRPEDYADERPPHRVRITRPFYMGTHEVTVGQFARFAQESGYLTEAEAGDGAHGWNGQSVVHSNVFTWRKPGFVQGADDPVVCVSWNDARAFCRWATGRGDGGVRRLPTEAEREYACRAGSGTVFHFAEDGTELRQFANFADLRSALPWCDASADDNYRFTAPVGRYLPNGFGLHDMLGNVWEWCADVYSERYYERSPASDPQGPPRGERAGRAWGLVAERGQVMPRQLPRLERSRVPRLLHGLQGRR